MASPVSHRKPPLHARSRSQGSLLHNVQCSTVHRECPGGRTSQSRPANNFSTGKKGGNQPKGKPGKGTRAPNDGENILETAAARREYLEWILVQDKEDQIAEHAAASVTNKTPVQSTCENKVVENGREAPTEDELIWESARLRVSASALASENDVLKSQLQKLMDHIAQLESKVAFTEESSKSQKARLNTIASKKVAQLEEQVGRQKNTMSELVVAAEALASDNVELSSQLAGMKEEKEVHTSVSKALEERLTRLQELYLRNIEEASSLESAGVYEAMRRRCMDELVTQEVLDASRPPKDFPVPQAPAVAKIRPALNEISTLHRERDRFQSHAKFLEEKVNKLEAENQEISRKGTRERNAAKQAASVHESRMLGVIRRMQYLVEQMKQKENVLQQKNDYIRRLESQLLTQSRKIQAQKRMMRERVSRDVKLRTGAVGSRQRPKPSGDTSTEISLPIDDTRCRSNDWFSYMDNQVDDLCFTDAPCLSDDSSFLPVDRPKTFQICEAPSSNEKQRGNDPRSINEQSPGSKFHGSSRGTTSSRPLEDTLASIEEMERQLKELDAEIKAGTNPDKEAPTQETQREPDNAQASPEPRSTAKTKARSTESHKPRAGYKTVQPKRFVTKQSTKMSISSRDEAKGRKRAPESSGIPSPDQDNAQQCGGAYSDVGAVVTPKTRRSTLRKLRSQSADEFSELDSLKAVHWIPGRLDKAKGVGDSETVSERLIGSEVVDDSDVFPTGESEGEQVQLPGEGPPNPFADLHKLRMGGVDSSAFSEFMEKLTPVKNSWEVYSGTSESGSRMNMEAGKVGERLCRSDDVFNSSSDDCEARRAPPPQPTPRC